MAYREIDDFLEKEMSIIYVGAGSAELKKVEVTLTENEIDYTLMEIPYRTVLGITERPGIGVYVVSGQAEYCRNLFLSAGLTQGLWMEDA